MKPWSRWARCLILAMSCAVVVACSEESPSPDPDTEDLPDMVVVEVGEKGGVVQAKGVSLTIPEGALDKNVMISAKVIDTDKVTIPSEAKDVVSAVYEFGPSGTKFNKPVQVQITTDKDEPSAKMYFTKEGDESQFEELASTSKSKTVTASTKHFSLAFAGIPAGAQPGGGNDAGVGGDGDDDELDSGMDEPDVEPEMDASAGGDKDGGKNPATRDGGVSHPADSGGPVDDEDASTGGGGKDGGGPVTKDGGFVVLDGGATTNGPDGSAGDSVIVTVNSRDPFGNPANQTWVAFQDGDGPWEQISAAPTGQYSFEVTSGRYGLVYTCANANSLGNILYAASSHTTVDIVQGPNCTGSMPSASFMTGNIIISTVTSGHMDGTTRWYRGSNGIEGSSTPFSVAGWYVGVTSDALFVAKDDFNNVKGMLFLRGLMPGGTSIPQDINFSTNGFSPFTGFATVTNSSDATFDVEYTVSGGKLGVPLRGAVTVNGQSMNASYALVPSQHASPNDRYRVYSSESGTGTQFREVEMFAERSDAYSVTLPNFFAPTINRAPRAYTAPSMNFADVPGATDYKLAFTFATGSMTVTTESGWFNAGEPVHTVTFPDLRGAPFFQAIYAPALNEGSMNTRGTATSVVSDATSTTRAASWIDTVLNPP